MCLVFIYAQYKIDKSSFCYNSKRHSTLFADFLSLFLFPSPLVNLFLLSPPLTTLLRVWGFNYWVVLFSSSPFRVHSKIVAEKDLKQKSISPQKVIYCSIFCRQKVYEYCTAL